MRLQRSRERANGGEQGGQHPSPDAPLGVFDSGLGGLTVVRRLQEVLPQERILYVADQTHVPYGGRPLPEVCGFACGISAALFAAGCKAVVMACNISSATALESVQANHPETPVLGVILPGAQAAAQSPTGRVGVLATAGTVQSGAYTRALHALKPTLQVTEVACPQFVPLVEAGEQETPAAYTAASEYLAPLQAAQVDTIILGCTHYPFLLPVLRALYPSVAYIDPAEQTACELTRLLTARQLRTPLTSERTPDCLLTTGAVATFTAQAHDFVPDVARRGLFGAAHWQGHTLCLPPASLR